MNKPTDEQVEIIDASSTGEDLVIEAAAGSGKTTTLKMLAARTRKRGVYLAYNRSVKEDAAKSFPASVRCATSHGLAYGPIATRYRHRLGGPRVPRNEAAKMLGINNPLFIEAGVAPLAYAQQAQIAIATVTRFCHSADDVIDTHHVPRVEGLETPARRKVVSQAIVPFARKAWEDIVNPQGKLRFDHDHYLKIWQLTRPIIPADYLLVDEAQDLNPAVQAIVSYQKDAQVILVGDRCQAIYGWRGATDAMGNAKGKRLQLTQSFRFGPAIADEANKWLEVLDVDMRVRGLPGINSTVNSKAGAVDAVLCRSNATAMREAIAHMDVGRKTAIVGGGGEIARMAYAAKDLKAGKPSTHPELLAFSSWRELVDHVEHSDTDSDLKVLINLVDEHGPDALIARTERLVDESLADAIISTAHKAKGREWDRVRIADDFYEPRKKPDGDRGEITRENAMLSYVAVTRAKSHLDRAGLSWVDKYLD